MSDSFKFDKVLEKLTKFKSELEKACGPSMKKDEGVNIDKAEDKPKDAVDAKNAEIKRQGGISPLKRIKKADVESLHMSEHGQWDIKKGMTPQDIRDGMAGVRGGGAGYKPAPIAKPKKMDKADECHADDPKHEEKEKKIASKIKDKAEDLADMHKDEAKGSKIMSQEAEGKPAAVKMHQEHHAKYMAKHPHLKSNYDPSPSQHEFLNDHYNDSLGHYAKTGKLKVHTEKQYKSYK